MSALLRHHPFGRLLCLIGLHDRYQCEFECCGGKLVCWRCGDERA